MSSTKDLLEHRKKLKRRTPDFRRSDSRIRRRIGDRWRVPRGVQNKIRKGRAGKPKKVSIGYSGPKKIRGLSRDGLNRVVVNNIQELSKLERGKDIVTISARVGNKKRIIILKEVKKLGIHSSTKDIDKEIGRLESEFIRRKEEKKKRLAEKTKKAKKSDKKDVVKSSAGKEEGKPVEEQKIPEDTKEVKEDESEKSEETSS